jgi:hypothetical protein
MSLKSVTRSDSLLKYSIARKTHYLSEKNAYITLWEKILEPFEEKFEPKLSDKLLMLELSYIDDIKYGITRSGAPWKKKVEIMNTLGIMLFTRLKIMELQSNKSHGIPRIRLATDYYKLFSNFETIKTEVILLNGHYNITYAYHSFIYEIKNALNNLIIGKKAIDNLITREGLASRAARVKQLLTHKKKFLEVYNNYRSVYLEFIDKEVKSICPTVALNEDVVWLIEEYL